MLNLGVTKDVYISTYFKKKTLGSDRLHVRREVIEN